MSDEVLRTGLPEPADLLRPIIKSQYQAAFEMLRDAIDQCNDNVWFDETRANAFWQIAYHTTFIAHAYLHRDHDSFRPWKGHQAGVQQPDALRPPREPDGSLPMLPDPYTRAQVLEYVDICRAMIGDAVDSFDLESQESGFPWYPVSKLEHQFISIRHVQHHAAQLADRLRVAQDVGVAWVGFGNQ